MEDSAACRTAHAQPRREIVFDADAAVDSFEVFYARELPALVAFAAVLSGSAAAEDIAQEAMLAAYRRWDSVCQLDLPVAWVRRACANRAISVLRRRAVETRGLLRLGSRPAATDAPAMVNADFWAEVRRLPRRQKQVIALHYIYDMAVSEIAQTLSCAEGTVKVHLSRGRATLAQRMGARAEEPS
jgi:RNA polymerase sigma-70 factor (ECF subfamily)